MPKDIQIYPVAYFDMDADFDIFEENKRMVERERKRRLEVQDTIRKTIKEKLTTHTENEELRNRIDSLETSLITAKTDTQSTKTQLESLASHFSQRLKSIKRLVIFLIITILLGLFLFLVNRYDLFKTIKSAINWIVSIGGLWTFLNFLLNLAKSLGIKK